MCPPNFWSLACPKQPLKRLGPRAGIGKGDLQFFKTVYIELLQNARDPNGYLALEWAIRSRHQACVEEICRRCPELIYNQDKVGATSVHWAVIYGDISILVVLINIATKVDLENGNIVGAAERKLTRHLDSLKRSPLLFVVFHSQLNMVKYLLGADPEFVPAPDIHSKTPLSLARKGAMKNTDPNTVKIAELLLENEKYQSKLSPKEQNWTPLQKATARGDIEAVKEMMDSSRNEIDLVDGEKRNFVHLAAQLGRTEIMKFVLEEADISARVLNAQDKYENTPLLVAGLFGNISTATCLVYDSRVLNETLNNHGQNFLDAVFASSQESGREKAKTGN